MKENHIKSNRKSNIFARIRSNNYGESQSFTSVDAALTWVQHTSRELVESGYSNVHSPFKENLIPIIIESMRLVVKPTIIYKYKQSIIYLIQLTKKQKQ